MSLEIHGGVKNPDNFQSLISSREEDHVATFGRDAATGKQFFAETVAEGVRTEGLDAGPQLPEVAFLLFYAPVSKV